MSIKQSVHPFRFVTQANLVELTGARAHSIRELLDYLKTASGAVVYYHTHHFLKQHHFLSPEPPNDFAFWVTNVLNEDKLGEQLAAIDTVRFPSVTALQEKIVATLEKYLTAERPLRYASAGDEFHFMKSKSFVLPTPYVACNLEEFLDCIKKISIYSLYHHMFEARMRLGRETNDFSYWLENELAEGALAKSIKQLDPYTQTLEGLRQRIVSITAAQLGKRNQGGSYAS